VEPSTGHAAEPDGPRFEGAAIPEQKFGDDDGTTPARLAEALATHDVSAVVSALRGQRLLVALVAQLDSVTATGEEKDSHMAAAMWQRPDGRTALLAFSSVAAMAQWDPQARPLPVAAAQVAQAALEDGAAALLIDRTVALVGPALWAVAEQRELESPAADTQVRDHVRELVAAHFGPAGLPTWCTLGADDGWVLTVVVHPDVVAQPQVVEALAQQLAGDPLLRSRTAGMNLAVAPQS
jgi:hypothetical protein